jgi:hypothetical protein
MYQVHYEGRPDRLCQRQLRRRFARGAGAITSGHCLTSNVASHILQYKICPYNGRKHQPVRIS